MDRKYELSSAKTGVGLLGQADKSTIINPQNHPNNYMSRLDTKKSNIKGHWTFFCHESGCTNHIGNEHVLRVSCSQIDMSKIRVG